MSYRFARRRLYCPALLSEPDPEITEFVLSLFLSAEKKMTPEDLEELLGMIDDVQGFKEKGTDIPRYISRKHMMEEFAKASKLSGS